MSVADALPGAVMAGLIGIGMLSAPASAQGPRTLRCESIQGEFNRCGMGWRDAELVGQASNGSCVRGQSWGVDQQGLWVDRGCRGLFAEARHGRPGDGGYGHGRAGYGGPGYGGAGYGGPGYGGADYGRGADDRYGRADGARPDLGRDRPIRLQCDSNHQRYQMCMVDVGRRGRVQLVSRVSDARCTEGYSWGWNRAGVWVDHGCRARFAVDQRW